MAAGQRSQRATVLTALIFTTNFLKLHAEIVRTHLKGYEEAFIIQKLASLLCVL